MSEATKPSPVTVSKDLEGVPETSTSTKSDTEMPSSTAPPQNAGGAGAAKPNTKQRKIAVLTSGGDSAGMNAAGTSRFSGIGIDIDCWTSPLSREEVLTI